jgi:DNA polymerase-3 subunit alpha
MSFATFIDRQWAVFDAVRFPPLAAKYPLRGRGIYRIRGKVASEFDFLSVEVDYMHKEAYIPDPRYSDPKGGRIRPGMPTSKGSSKR